MAESLQFICGITKTGRKPCGKEYKRFELLLYHIATDHLRDERQTQLQRALISAFSSEAADASSPDALESALLARRLMHRIVRPPHIRRRNPRAMV